jgi:hypothetical protein
MVRTGLMLDFNLQYVLGGTSNLCSTVWVMVGVLQLLVGSVISLFHVW